jgi:hypothetical protein
MLFRMIRMNHLVLHRHIIAGKRKKGKPSGMNRGKLGNVVNNAVNTKLRVGQLRETFLGQSRGLRFRRRRRRRMHFGCADTLA